jgi:hypothetical protein
MKRSKASSIRSTRSSPTDNSSRMNDKKTSLCEDVSSMATTLLLEVIDIEAHLISRGIDPERTYVIVDKAAGLATFILYNASGKLVGYQLYNPAAPKGGSAARDRKFGKYLMKYYTYTSKVDRTNELAVWGLETVSTSDDLMFVVEGIFDAVKIHNAGYPAIAVLTNDPKHLKGWFMAMGKFVIVVEDNDAKAGSSLGRIGDVSVKTPDPYKDLGDMPQNEVNSFLKMLIESI